MSAEGFALLVVAAVLIGVPWFTFNRLVAGRHAVRAAHAQIDVQLKRRHDLVPALVESVAAGLRHERGTLQAVVEARNSAVEAMARQRGAGPARPNQSADGQAEVALTRALADLRVVIEAYPELRAQQGLAELGEALTSTENRIAFARQYCNDEIQCYNNSVEQFPNNVLSGLFGFRIETPLVSVTQAAEREPVAIRLP